MSTSNRVYERFHLVSLFAAPEVLRESTETPLDLVLAVQKSRAPFRAMLQKSSGYNFVNDIADAMRAEGVPMAIVGGAVEALVNRPSLGIRHATGASTAVLHGATVFHEELGTAVLLVRGEIVAGTPPEATFTSLSVFLVETDDAGLVLASEASSISVYLEELQRELGLKRIDDRPPDAPASWGVLGTRASRFYDIPADWEQRFESMGVVLGMRTFLAASPAEAMSRQLHQSVDVLLLLDDEQDWDRFLELRAENDYDTVQIEVGATFSDFESRVRSEVVGYVRQAVDPPPTEPRILQPGDVFYHRKIPPQPSKYDRFSEGQPVGCGHGGEMRLKKAPKAVKGMHRIYSNFDDSMLFHCSKYPQCGMYIVKCPGRAVS